MQRFLVLDDDPTLGPLTCRGLTKRGFAADWAADVAAAMALCQRQPYQYAVLDLRLAEGTSLPLIPWLKSQFPDIQILMLTGFASIATAVSAIKSGACNYLPKPASLTEVLGALGVEAGNSAPAAPPQGDDVMSSRRLEWEHIQQVLQQNQGNVSAAARQLHMHRRTLQRKLQKKPVAQ